MYVCVQLDANVIHALELDVPHIIPLTSSGDVTITVTLIDARYCPGSVMFLFDGYFGRILYTGDFRYEAGMLDQGPLNKLKLHPVDVLYIDNTFCSPKCLLPSRQEAKRQIVNIIEQHPGKRVVFGLRELGKESVLISLGKCFDVRITVPEERYHLLEVLALHQQYVMACEGAEHTRFEVVELVEVTQSRVDAWNKKTPTIAILLTGLFVGLGYQPFAGSSDVFVVPLSNHSPYAELQEFVAQICPKSVVPIVRADPAFNDDPLSSSLLDRTNVECFAEHLDKKPMQKYHIPLSVLEMMNHPAYETTRRRARKQAYSCSKSDSSTCMSVSNSGQKLLSNSSLLTSTSLALANTMITTSESKRNIVQWSCMNTCNTVTSTIVRKPQVAVRPVRRCLPSDRHLQSPFIKQRRHYQVNFPAPFESQQKRFIINELQQKECQQLAAPTCKSKSPVPSTSNNTNVHPAAEVLSLKQDNETYKRHPDMLDTISDVAHDLSSTVYHPWPVSGSGDSVNINHVDSMWQLFHKPVSTVFQLAELQANTDGMPASHSVDCHDQGFEHMKDTTALGVGCELPSAIVFNHNFSNIQIPAYDADGALNLTTSNNTSTAQAGSIQVQESWNSLLNSEHSSDSLHQFPRDSSGLLENVRAQVISDPSPHRVSSTTDMLLPDGIVADDVSVSCEFLPFNQMHYWSVDKATHGTALESRVDSRLMVHDHMFHAPAEDESLLKLSQHHVKGSHNVALQMTAENVNRTEEMSTREVHPSSQLTLGMKLDNYDVLGGDENTVDAAVMKLTSLPAVVEFAYSNETWKVLQETGDEHETAVLEITAAGKSTVSADKQGDLQCDARVADSTKLTGLPPKKKWREQFRISEV